MLLIVWQEFVSYFSRAKALHNYLIKQDKLRKELHQEASLSDSPIEGEKCDILAGLCFFTLQILFATRQLYCENFQVLRSSEFDVFNYKKGQNAQTMISLPVPFNLPFSIA